MATPTANLSKIIDESLKLPTVEAAVNHILIAEGTLKKGSQVAVLDDPYYGMNGLIGTVEGAADKGDGFVNVRFESGVVLPLQSTLLCPL